MSTRRQDFSRGEVGSRPYHNRAAHPLSQQVPIDTAGQYLMSPRLNSAIGTASGMIGDGTGSYHGGQGGGHGEGLTGSGSSFQAYGGDWPAPTSL